MKLDDAGAIEKLSWELASRVPGMITVVKGRPVIYEHKKICHLATTLHAIATQTIWRIRADLGPQLIPMMAYCIAAEGIEEWEPEQITWYAYTLPPVGKRHHQLVKENADFFAGQIIKAVEKTEK